MNERLEGYIRGKDSDDRAKSGTVRLEPTASDDVFIQLQAPDAASFMRQLKEWQPCSHVSRALRFVVAEQRPSDTRRPWRSVRRCRSLILALDLAARSRASC